MRLPRCSARAMPRICIPPVSQLRRVSHPDASSSRRNPSDAYNSRERSILTGQRSISAAHAACMPSHARACSHDGGSHHLCRCCACAMQQKPSSHHLTPAAIRKSAAARALLALHALQHLRSSSNLISLPASTLSRLAIVAPSAGSMFHLRHTVALDFLSTSSFVGRARLEQIPAACARFACTTAIPHICMQDLG